jgi:Imidazolonepropionase and related amidohydrolases
MATKKIPVDPVAGGRCILQGRIVTMNAQFKVIDAGRIYLADGLINAVRSATASPPRGFESAPIIDTGGTIYPGLIELHNHLSYDALQLWQVPRIFAHRGQWSNHPDKKRLISQPMSVLASIGGMIEALVRYVEAKCLVAGVTTSQGLTLVAAPGIEHRYRGIVRNVENTDDPSLPEALTRIADVTSAADFANDCRRRRARFSCILRKASVRPRASTSYGSSSAVIDGPLRMRSSAFMLPHCWPTISRCWPTTKPGSCGRRSAIFFCTAVPQM